MGLYSFSSDLLLDYNKDKCFSLVLYSITNLKNTKIENLIVDKSKGLIKFQIDNYLSFGELIVISIKSISKDKTNILITSSFKIWAIVATGARNFFTFSKNRKNVELISNAIQENIKNKLTDYDLIMSKNQEIKIKKNKVWIDKYLVFLIISIILLVIIFSIIITHFYTPSNKSIVCIDENTGMEILPPSICNNGTGDTKDINEPPKFLDKTFNWEERQAKNFEECLEWGFIYQGYPESCRDGNITFINPEHIDAPTLQEQQACNSDSECVGKPSPCQNRICINEKWVKFYEITPAICPTYADPLVATAEDCICIDNICTNKKLIQS